MDLKSLSQFEEIGGLVSDQPVEKEITWNNGKEDIVLTVRIRPLAYGDFDKIIAGHDDERSQNAALIAASVLVEKDQSLPYVKAYQLKPSLAAAIIEAVTEVNQVKS